MGAVLIVFGLYAVLWGKYKEYKEKEMIEAIAEPVKNLQNNRMMMVEEDCAAENDIEMQKTEANNRAAAAGGAAPAPSPASAITAPATS